MKHQTSNVEILDMISLFRPSVWIAFAFKLSVGFVLLTGVTESVVSRIRQDYMLAQVCHIVNVFGDCMPPPEILYGMPMVQVYGAMAMYALWLLNTN